MANVIEDLWPDVIKVSETSARSPVAILRQQAAYLGDKTQNIVQAEVSTSTTSTRRGVLPFADTPPYDFAHTFRLVAPALDNYKYDLFIVMHNMTFYPLMLTYEGKRYEADNEHAFIRELQAILSSPRTTEIIDQLVTMSTQ